MRWVVVPFVISILFVSCAGEDGGPGIEGIQRLIEPPAGELSCAGLDRVQIRTETRPALATTPSEALRWQDPVVLGDSLQVSVEVPPHLASRDLRLDAWVTVPEEKDRTKKLLVRRAQELGGRDRFAAPAVILTGKSAREAPISIEIPIPLGLAGITGLVSVMARPMPDSAIQRIETRAFTIPRQARLDFGFGVEEAGWDEGWPPVLFRVSAVVEGAEDPEDSGASPLFERRIDPAGDPRDRRWFDGSVSLAGFAGREVRFIFESEALKGIPGSTVERSFSVFSNPEIVHRSVRRRRNLILISLDTLRASSVGAYGSLRDTTPSIDRRIAAQGALVRFAVASRPYTPPSHMTMFTGLDSCVHQVTSRKGVLAPERVTLAEILRSSGYRTTAITENAYVVAGAGFARGFDRYLEHQHEEAAHPGFADETFRAAEQWIAAESERPFFLFIHTYQVHRPYRPPRGYRDFFQGDGRDAGVRREKDRENRLSYDQEVRYVDDLLAGFLDTLETQGLIDDTLLVVTSDHGEGFGEHLLVGHGFSVNDEALLVPLLVLAPGLIEPGTIVEEQVGLIDLMPTLLDLLEIPLPVEVQGRSFAGLLRGVESSFASGPIVVSASRQHGVRTRDFKYIASHKGDHEALYDLRADPAEKKNLAKTDPDRLAAMKRIYEEHEQSCAEFIARNPGEGQREQWRENQPGWLINRDEIDRKLRAFGYVE